MFQILTHDSNSSRNHGGTQKHPYSRASSGNPHVGIPTLYDHNIPVENHFFEYIMLLLLLFLSCLLYTSPSPRD